MAWRMRKGSTDFKLLVGQVIFRSDLVGRINSQRGRKIGSLRAFVWAMGRRPFLFRIYKEREQAGNL